MLGDSQLAGVVQQCRGLDRLQRFGVGYMQRPGEPHCVGLNAMNVVTRDAIFSFDCRRKR
jgi:hypothetical protein